MQYQGKGSHASAMRKGAKWELSYWKLEWGTVDNIPEANTDGFIFCRR
jgi:hypothetical protein